MSKDMVAYKEVGMQLGLSGTELKEFMREERTRQDELTLAREKQEREAQLAREKQAAEDKRAEIRLQDELKAAREKQAEELKIAREKQVAEDLRQQEQLKMAREKQAEEMKIAREKQVAEDRRREEELKIAREKQVAEDLRQQEEMKIAREKIEEELKLAREKQEADERRRQDELKMSELKIQEELKAAEAKRQDYLGLADLKRQDGLAIARDKQASEEQRREKELQLARERQEREAQVQIMRVEIEREYKIREQERQERSERQDRETNLRIAEENRNRNQHEGDGEQIINAGNAFESAAMKRIRDIPHLKQTDRQAIEEYLSNFVRICSMHNIAKGEYCRYLAPKLPPSLSAILVRMPIDKANDFKALKSAIFSQYLLDADYFRSRFYSLTQDTFESAFEYVRCLRELQEKWLSSEKVEESYAAVLDFFLKNQFMRKVSTDKTVFLKERTPDPLDKLCELSDVFDQAHIRHGKPSYNSSSNSGILNFTRTGVKKKTINRQWRIRMADL